MEQTVDNNAQSSSTEGDNTNKVKIAVFDFDDTSIEGSSPSWLVNKLLLGRKLKLRNGFLIGFWGLAYKWHLPQNEAWVRGQVFSAFEGQPEQEVNQYLCNFYDQVIAKRFRPQAAEAMRKCKEEGCEVVVVSASFEPIVQRAMEQQPFDHQISTRMRVDENGNYTREVVGRPIEGEEKLIALRHWCDGRYGEGNWEIEYAFGDHHSDVTLLEAAKHPFVVTPNSGLKKIAAERHWPVLDWSIDVPKKQSSN